MALKRAIDGMDEAARPAEERADAYAKLAAIHEIRLNHLPQHSIVAAHESSAEHH